MTNKPFNRSLYNRYDGKARKWFAKVLPEGYTAEDNPRKTGVDVIVRNEDGDIVFYVELEVKCLWKRSFPFRTLHLPERKKKYTSLKYPTLFVIFNNDGTQYKCVWSKYVLKSPLVEVRNRYVYRGEMFFDIPVKYVDSDIEDALRRHWRT
jgi:hypothetical protein